MRGVQRGNKNGYDEYDVSVRKVRAHKYRVFVPFGILSFVHSFVLTPYVGKTTGRYFQQMRHNGQDENGLYAVCSRGLHRHDHEFLISG